jgi:Glycosyl hydrolase family 99
MRARSDRRHRWGRHLRRGGVLALLVPLCLPSSASAAQRQGAGPIPTLAYYYIWYTATSGDRAKLDYPLLGRYSSDERRVMQQHVEWAKRAGIEGFIVSWKSTSDLNRRLRQLVGIARKEHFKLAIIYEGLDFHREPLPVQKVDSDFDYFAREYGDDPVFRIFGDKPAMMWSGTWRFTPDDIAAVTRGRRDRLLILASQKNERSYRRIADLVDGDAYYWSSVNPSTFPGYREKLDDMGRAVHEHGGLWIAPAAPGFDARLVGGTTVVPRRDGANLRTQLDAALASSPDAIGLISWNEFSENSQIEPSRRYGNRYLRLLAEVNGREFGEEGVGVDSSDPGTGLGYGVALIGVFAALFAGSLVLLRRRRDSTEETGAT